MGSIWKNKLKEVLEEMKLSEENVEHLSKRCANVMTDLIIDPEDPAIILERKEGIIKKTWKRYYHVYLGEIKKIDQTEAYWGFISKTMQYKVVPTQKPCILFTYHQGYVREQNKLYIWR